MTPLQCNNIGKGAFPQGMSSYFDQPHSQTKVPFFPDTNVVHLKNSKTKGHFCTISESRKAKAHPVEINPNTPLKIITKLETNRPIETY